MSKRKIIVEVEFEEDNDSINRNRVMEIFADSLYRADVSVFDKVSDEEEDWEELSDGAKFRYSSFAVPEDYPRIEEYVESFRIFQKYWNFNIAAEHDEIWAGPDSSEISEQDLEKLKELGWNDYGEGCLHMFV